MYANQTDVQKILGGVQQYVVPLYQRPYSWEAKQWGKLWTDLVELCEDPKPRNHFIGSIVTMPERSVPEGVSKFVLIDGQQRLTTLLIVLTAARDKARRDGDGRLADKIDDLMLRNRHQDDTDVYKVLPTQDDRAAFCGLIDGRPPDPAAGVAAAYVYFDRKLRATGAPSLDALYTVVCKHLVLVSIVLDRDDNPHLIFESLNATGQPLTQSDLVRNFVLMRVHTKAQERVFRECWKPMEDRLGKHLTDFMRHFLMRDGQVVKLGDVYMAAKEAVDDRGEDGAVVFLAELAAFSEYYSRLTDPGREPSKELSPRLARLHRIEATTAYPFLLNVYHDYAGGRLSEADVAAVLDMLEAFLIRRYVCGVPTNALGKIFVALYAQAAANGPLVEGVRRVLADKGFPRDGQFREAFVTVSLYGGGDRRDKAKFVLERLEGSFAHKEPADLSRLTIEHVMPQTLTAWWKSHLGPGWEAVHESWRDSVGNLTLTGYNSELSNADFPRKRAELTGSHVELSRSFGALERWDADAIARRGEALADRALAVWSDFARRPEGPDTSADPEEEREEYAAILELVLLGLGGAAAQVGSGRFRIHRLADGRIVNLKYSRSHGKYYWFGMHASLWDDMRRAGATHLVLVLGDTGYATVPASVTADYLTDAGTSPKGDGTVRHYHILVSTGSRPELFHHGRPARVPIANYFTPFPAGAAAP